MDDKDLLIAELRQELEAAKNDLYRAQRCNTCKHFKTGICDSCKNKSVYFFNTKYQWRGVCPENTLSLRYKRGKENENL